MPAVISTLVMLMVVPTVWRMKPGLASALWLRLSDVTVTVGAPRMCDADTHLPSARPPPPPPPPPAALTRLDSLRCTVGDIVAFDFD